MTIQNCKCACGQTEFVVTGEPKLRMICHCTICQKFNAAPLADVLVYKTTQVPTPAEGVVIYKSYKRPPNVQRGKCSKCNQAVIEVLDMPLFPKLTMVPAGMFAETAHLPEPKAHMFYEKRIEDVADDLPKCQGFFSSQLAFFKYLWFS